jgi:hypothetical protein
MVNRVAVQVKGDGEVPGPARDDKLLEAKHPVPLTQRALSNKGCYIRPATPPAGPSQYGLAGGEAGEGL